MNVIAQIKYEHDEVADMFDHLVVLARDARHSDEAARIAARLVALVRIHADAEERVVYQVLRTLTPALKVFALGGPHQHEVLDTTLDKLLVRRPGDEEYPVIVRVARDLFDMHARDEEETEMLPQLQQAVSDEGLDTLGEDMRAEEARIRPRILRQVGMPARAA